MTQAPSKADLYSQLDPSLRLKYEKSLAESLGLVFPDNDLVWCRPRECLVTGGVRSGKSLRAGFRVLVQLLNPKTRLVWIVAPTYGLAQEVFRYVDEWTQTLGLQEPGSKSVPKDGSRSLRTTAGATVETKTGEDAQRLASVPVDFIVIDEPAQCSSEVYEACLGRLLQKRGDLFMSGTLDDNSLKPRWQWYEDLAMTWRGRSLSAREISFVLPSWSNVVEFPLGRSDPEFDILRERLGEHKFNRMYAGQPSGAQFPMYPLLHEPGAEDSLLTVPEEGTIFRGGAIGVDYGRTWDHPSAIVVIAEDNYGRFWVRDAWKGIRAAPEEIESVVRAFEHNHNIRQGCVDPNQGFMGDTLGFSIAASGSGSTEMRFSLTNALLENNALFFDINGSLVRETYASMKLCSHVSRNGVLRYERPLGDDLAQCVNYAVEYLRSGASLPVIPLEAGALRFRNLYIPADRESRI